MSKTVSKFALTAGFVLAMAFTFSCSSDDGGGDGGSVAYEGQTYKTVKIGTQTWRAENLNYAVAGSKCYGEGGKVRDEENDITKTLSPAEVQANCVKYGRLYDWLTAMALPSNCNESSCSSQIQPKHRGICPSGWHIPSDAEWDVLINYVGGYETAGTKLKTTNGWNWNDYDNESGNGTDDFGFSALPGGNGYFDFTHAGYGGSWWSATEFDASHAYCRFMYYDYSVVHKSISDGKPLLYSVRCIADESVAPSGSSSSSSSITYESKGNNISSYKTVKIGNQTWMAENLDYAVEGSKCWGEDGILDSPLTPAEIQANCDKYGRLYSWVMAMELDINCYHNSCENQIQAQHRGICPSGWHIPSDAEWTTLTDYVDGYETAGTKLKATSGWNNSGNGTDEYGFSALPGGSGQSMAGSFYYGDVVGDEGNWWSATESYASDASLRIMDYGSSYVSSMFSGGLFKGNFFSLRCLQD